MAPRGWCVPPPWSGVPVHPSDPREGLATWTRVEAGRGAGGGGNTGNGGCRAQGLRMRAAGGVDVKRMRASELPLPSALDARPTPPSPLFWGGGGVA